MHVKIRGENNKTGGRERYPRIPTSMEKRGKGKFFRPVKKPTVPGGIGNILLKAGGGTEQKRTGDQGGGGQLKYGPNEEKRGEWVSAEGLPGRSYKKKQTGVRLPSQEKSTSRRSWEEKKSEERKRTGRSQPGGHLRVYATGFTQGRKASKELCALMGRGGGSVKRVQNY